MAGLGWSYLTFHPRAQDWADVGVAALVERTNGGVGRAAIALTKMGATPLRAGAVEHALGAGERPERRGGGRVAEREPVADSTGPRLRTVADR